MTRGIYAIQHIVSAKEYIGSSHHIEKRWGAHLSGLRNCRHHSNYLQNAFNKHGEDAFRFVILEAVEGDTSLIVREQHYIDTRKPVYNVLPAAGSPLGYKVPEAQKQVPGYRESKQYASSCVNRETQAISIRAAKARPEVREKSIARGKENWENPDFRRKCLEALEINRIDPIIEARRVAATRVAGQRRFESNIYYNSRCYTQRLEGKSWEAVSLAEGKPVGTIVATAERYAIKMNLPWPPPEVGRVMNTGRHGASYYADFASGMSTSEVAAKHGVRNTSSQVCSSARVYSRKHNLPWPAYVPLHLAMSDSDVKAILLSKPKSSKLYYDSRLLGVTWQQMAEVFGLKDGDSAYNAACSYAKNKGLPKPPTKSEYVVPVASQPQLQEAA